MTRDNWPEMLFAALVLIAGMLLVAAGVLHGVAELALFLWSGEWLSPVDVLALKWPVIQEAAWIAEPEKLVGVHRIVTSPWFSVAAVLGGFVVAVIGRILAERSRRGT